MVVYLDLLIIVTLLSNGAIFYTAGILSGAEIKKWRLALAVILALILTLGLLTSWSGYLITPLSRIISSAVLAFIAYPWRGRQMYLRQLIILVLTAAVMSSLTLLCHALTNTVPVTTGIAVPNNKPTMLNLLTALGLLIAFTYYHRKIKALPPDNVFYTVQLELDQKTLRLKALADTGNRLRSLEGKGVILGAEAAVRELLSENLSLLLRQEPPLEADQILLKCAAEPYANRLQLISYATIDRQSMLLAIRLDKALVYNKKKVLCFLNPILAFAPAEVGQKAEFDLIIPAQMLR